MLLVQKMKLWVRQLRWEFLSANNGQWTINFEASIPSYSRRFIEYVYQGNCQVAVIRIKLICESRIAS